MNSFSETATVGSMVFAAFDLETTGMDPLYDQIIEIGVTVFQRTRVLKTVHHLVKPAVPISKEAFEVHGIKAEALADKPTLQDVLPEILSTLSEAIPVAHNAPFDVSFLVESARQSGLAFPLNLVVDSCQLSKGLFPQFSTHRLTFLIEKFGFACEKAHRALSDSHCCFLLFCRAVEELPLKWDMPWERFCSTASGILSLQSREVAVPEKLAPFKGSLFNHERLVLSYQDGKGEVTRREVTPMGLSVDGKKTVLIGYCHLRHGTRTFRLDRILDIQVPKA